MSRPAPTTPAAFECDHCGRAVPMSAPGTRHRNHCPSCLRSRHVDDTPGDRAAGCGGVMEPIGVHVRANDEWALIHRCTRCGALKTNRIAGDDEEAALLKLALRPLTRLPFPVELNTRGRL